MILDPMNRSNDWTLDTVEEEELWQRTSFLIEGVLVPVLAIFGIAGNNFRT